MSFSSEIKDRLCSVPLNCVSCAAAELSGIIRFSGALRQGGIRLCVDSGAAESRIARDLYEGFGFRKAAAHREGGRSAVFDIDDVNEAENIKAMISSEELMPFRCCRVSFVRGAFIGGGSVSDPRRNYHLEFDARTAGEAEHLRETLGSIGIAAKITGRKGRMIVYIKDAEQIAALLGQMGAGAGALEIFNVQVEKQLRNDINRRVNCENANTDKTARASSKHIHAIQTIKKAGKWDKLPDALKEIGCLRTENPEMSLRELGALAAPPIGKSGVNHRLNRILEISEGLAADAGGHNAREARE